MNLAGKKIHFMGAGGIGVSALAAMARQEGAQVTACDRAANDMTAMLQREGIPVALGHSPDHVRACDLLVCTSAVPADHPERKAAASVMRRGEFLAQFMNRVKSWGVAGTHGKTTTSWLLAAIALEADLDPTVFIGGVVPGLGDANYRLGTGPFVAELDESDGSFLEPSLHTAVVTNIESDHLSHYGDDKALFAAFSRFAEGVRESGVLVAGSDSPMCRELFRDHSGQALWFGLREDADLAARDIRHEPEGISFNAVFRRQDLGRFTLCLHGLHNVQNALAAMGAALANGIAPDHIRTACAAARGVGRRMELLGMCRGVPLYSDYAHHPTEVQAAIAAFREMHSGRTLVVFQPHLYSRTRDYADAFGHALGAADAVLLVDIYPAREEPLPGVTSALLVDGTRTGGADVYGPVALKDTRAEVERLAPEFAAVVMMGAGDIDDVARRLAT